MERFEKNRMINLLAINDKSSKTMLGATEDVSRRHRWWEHYTNILSDLVPMDDPTNYCLANEHHCSPSSSYFFSDFKIDENPKTFPVDSILERFRHFCKFKNKRKFLTKKYGPVLKRAALHRVFPEGAPAHNVLEQRTFRTSPILKRATLHRVFQEGLPDRFEQ